MQKWITRTSLNLHGLLLVALAIGWLAGILLASWFTLPGVGLLAMAVLALSATGIFWRYPLARLVSLTLFCLCLGGWRYTTVLPSNDANAIYRSIGASKLEIQAEIVDEPKLETHTTLLTVAVQEMSQDKGATWSPVDGKIQVQALGSTFDNPYAPRYGDTIQLTGQLTSAPSYTTPEIQASMTFPTLSITGRSGNSILVALYQLRIQLASVIMQALPQPYAALLVAIFLSLRTPALKPLIPAFVATGTVHLIAPSGFKVTLLAGLMSAGTGWLVPKKGEDDRWLLPAERKRGNWRRWLRTLLVILGIVIYTILSGAGPAAIRAGIMGLLLVLAPRLGRFYNVYNALAFAALVITLYDPFLLWDVGFLLSFFGTLGIVFFTPYFLYFLRFLDRFPLGHRCAENVAVTIAAQLATFPIFVVSFDQIAIAAVPANIFSVPLLAMLLALGALICLGGLLSPLLAQLCGWLVWPLLWYITTVVQHFKVVISLSIPKNIYLIMLCCLYYTLLILFGAYLFTRWKLNSTHRHQWGRPLFSRPVRYALLCSCALLILLITGVQAQTNQANGRLTIRLLTTGDTTQGKALLLCTPAGETALIDEGADNNTLSQTLDTYLPPWQRSLSLIILTDTSANNLAGLQDIVTRYQIHQVIDAGMLHPSVAYGRWRSTLVEHKISYSQVRQGVFVSLDSQTAFQVLWPPAQLHKGSDETRDNALVLRLLAPGLSMLLLNSTAMSTFALRALSTSVAPATLQAQIVQITGEQGKSLPSELSMLLNVSQPSRLLVITTPARKSKKASAPTDVTQPAIPSGSWRVLQGKQDGSLDLYGDIYGWHVDTS